MISNYMCTFAHNLGELEMANKTSNDFFDKINAMKAGLSAGQLLVVAEQCLDSAIFLSGRSNKQQRDVMTDLQYQNYGRLEVKNGKPVIIKVLLKLKSQQHQHRQMLVKFHKNRGLIAPLFFTQKSVILCGSY